MRSKCWHVLSRSNQSKQQSMALVVNINKYKKKQSTWTDSSNYVAATRGKKKSDSTV